MLLPADVERWERQVAELEALQAVYPEAGAVEEDVPGLLLRVQQALESQPSDLERAPQLSGRVRLHDAPLVGGEPLALHFSLPRGYPGKADPVLQVECGAARAVHDELDAAAAAGARDAAGAEALLLALERLREAAAGAGARGPDPSPAAGLGAAPAAPAARGAGGAARQPCAASGAHGKGGPGRGAAAGGQDEAAGGAGGEPLARRVIWFHHIKSPTKRRRIVEWADELDIGGFSVIGYPGVIVCEGAEDDIMEYVKRIRSLRWLAMALRAQETAQEGAPGGAGRCFAAPDARPLRELPAQGGLSTLGAECRAVGLEHLFKAALKIGG